MTNKNVWVCFDKNGFFVSATMDEDDNDIIGSIKKDGLLDVTGFKVIKNPDGWFDGCYCYIENGKVKCEKPTRENAKKDQDNFNKRFPLSIPVDEVAELKKELAEMKEIIKKMSGSYP